MSDQNANIPSKDLICTLKRLFNLLQRPFEVLRHTDKCDRNTKNCHKVYGCRYKFYNYDYVIRELLYFCQEELKMPGVYDNFKGEFNNLSKRKKQQMDVEFGKLIDYLGWTWPRQNHKSQEKPVEAPVRFCVPISITSP